MKSHNPLQPVTTRAILLTLFLFMLISVSNAQVTCAPSGTGIRPNTTTVPTSPVWLNVFYHIVRKTDHTGGIAPSEIGNITTYLNRYFNPYGL